MDYLWIPSVVLVGTANVAQSVAFIAKHERSTHINYFVIDNDAPQKVSDKIKFIGREQIAEAVRGVDVVFMLTALNDAATCKTARFIADCVKNENVWLSVGITQSASNEFANELNYLEQKLKVVINLEEQQSNQPAENFSYKIVHGIHSVYDEKFYPYVRPIDGADLVYFLTCGRKTFVSFGEASGENANVAAVNAAMDSPFIKKRLQEARSVFLNTMGATDYLSLFEESEASTLVYEAANPDGEIYPAVNLDEALGEKIFVIIFIRV